MSEEKVGELLKRFRLFDFHSFSGQSSSAASVCLPLQPSLVPAQQQGLMHHCAGCSQQVLAAEGFGGARWEAGVHCNAKHPLPKHSQGG